jgi:hypothetical protein
VAREARELDPQTAQDAAWQALGSLEIDFEERQSLENLLAEFRTCLEPAQDVPSRGVGSEPQATFSAADLIEPEPEFAEPDPGAPDTRPDPIELEESIRQLDPIVAVPTDFDSEGLLIETEDGDRKRVRFDHIEAVSVAAVDGLGMKTVLVLDLVLNWTSPRAELLKVVRLRGDRFDPRRLAPDCAEPLDALRSIIGRILDETDAIPLPDLQSVRGMPFAAFSSLHAYQRHVLMVEEDRLDPYAWIDES